MNLFACIQFIFIHSKFQHFLQNSDSEFEYQQIDKNQLLIKRTSLFAVPNIKLLHKSSQIRARRAVGMKFHINYFMVMCAINSNSQVYKTKMVCENGKSLSLICCRAKCN